MENLEPKKSKKNIWFSLFLIVNITVVALLGFHEFQQNSEIGLTDVAALWFKNWPYFIFVLICPLMTLLLEGLKYIVMIYKTTGRLQFWLGLKVGVMGKYYDNVTPLASGGQPFQMYYLHKGGVPSGVSGSLPIAGFFFTQLSFLTICLITFISNGKVIQDDAFRIVAYVGLVISVTVPFSLIFFSLMPKAFTKTLNFFINVLVKMKIIHHRERVTQKVLHSVEGYKQSLLVLAKSKTIILSYIFSLMYQIFLCSIPYYVMKSFGADVNFYDSLTMTAFTYAAISFVPTPGNSGAAEFSFSIIFTVLTGSYMFWGMMLWRFSSYYLYLLIGLPIIIYDYFKKRYEIKKEDAKLINEVQHNT